MHQVDQFSKSHAMFSNSQTKYTSKNSIMTFLFIDRQVYLSLGKLVQKYNYSGESWFIRDES